MPVRYSSAWAERWWPPGYAGVSRGRWAMRRLLIGIVVAALLTATLASATTTGRSTLRSMTQRWQYQAILLYHEVWVAAAWPVENGLRLASHRGPLLQAPLRSGAARGSSARPAAGN